MHRVLMFSLVGTGLLFGWGTPSDAEAFARLKVFRHRVGYCDVVEPSCCAPEPSCCAPEPSCCAPEPSCCESKPGFFKRHLFKRQAHKTICCEELNCCDEPSCCPPAYCPKISHRGHLFRWLFACHQRRVCAPACGPVWGGEFGGAYDIDAGYGVEASYEEPELIQ